MKYCFEYSAEYFSKYYMSGEAYEVLSSNEWSDDPSYIDQEKRVFNKIVYTKLLQTSLSKC